MYMCNSIIQNSLEKFLIFSIYQNYTLALTDKINNELLHV